MLTRDEIATHLQATGHAQTELFALARKARDRYYGNGCFIRGVIEITNECAVNCDYCEMQKKNKVLERYALTEEEILVAATCAGEYGIQTLFLQSGQVPKAAALAEIVLPSIKAANQSAILCLGNHSDDWYKRLRQAGADGYILKIETADPQRHNQLRHDPLDKRLHCLSSLRRHGYHVGTGIICGLPGETTESLIDDLQFVGQQQWSMCSVSPFIPPVEAPLKGEPPCSLDAALNVLAVMRLLQPSAMIPTVSAMEILEKDAGQVRGLLAGANVITVNLTPAHRRSQYRLYRKDRLTIDLPQAEQAIQKAGLTRAEGLSLGPVIVSGDEVPQFFEQKWGLAESLPVDRSVYDFRNPQLEQLIRTLEPGGRVMDLGCGDGRHVIPWRGAASPCALLTIRRGAGSSRDARRLGSNSAGNVAHRFSSAIPKKRHPCRAGRELPFDIVDKRSALLFSVRSRADAQRDCSVPATLRPTLYRCGN